jgi:hypothetical protein
MVVRGNLEVVLNEGKIKGKKPVPEWVYSRIDETTSFTFFVAISTTGTELTYRISTPPFLGKPG